MNKELKISVLKGLKSGLLSKVEAKTLISLNGVFTPNLSRNDKEYQTVCRLFDNIPGLISLFKIDFSQLTDEELRGLIKLQSKNNKSHN